LNIVEGPRSSNGAADTGIAININTEWPFMLAADGKDELQLILDGVRKGSLELSAYLMELFERASMYFNQIGRHNYPPQRVQQIHDLQELARLVRMQDLPVRVTLSLLPTSCLCV
jgi:hypothetical protein